MKKILVYDDDVDILEVCSVILTLKGWDVLCKENCLQIFQDIQIYGPDVIVMDNWLPGMDGVEAIQLIKNTPIFTNIPIIFFSANSYAEELAKKAGADYMLSKPFEIAVFEKLIVTATQRNS